MARRLHERALSRARAARAGGQDLGAAPVEEPGGAPAKANGGARLAYLLALAYLGIAAMGVSHRDLLLEAPVTLPLLGAVMPLRTFFVVAPIIVLVLHAGVLARSARVAARASGLAPRHMASDTGVGILLEAMAFLALAVAPVLVLLAILVQFLPYHDQAITWLHRLAVLADVVLVWLLWPAIVERRETLHRPDPERYRGLLIAGLVSIVLAFAAATFPGEWLDAVVGRQPGWSAVHDLLVHGEVDEIGRRRKSLFSSTLVLPGFDAPAAAGLGDARTLEAARRGLDLRGRHLEGAVLIGADLRKTDLTGALLEEVRLDHADLQGATLDDAWLRRASLAEASLRGALMSFTRLPQARLDGAELQGASLVGAQLEGASLADAQLQDAALGNAQLRGASLPRARLGGATLGYAQLQGAKLDGAELQNATLDHAQLQGASLGSVQLQGASLLAAQLQGAFLDRAELQGAMLLGANLAGASLARAGLQGAVLRDAVLLGASLDEAQLQGAVLDYAELQGALLRGVQLQGASLRGATLIGTSLERANAWRAALDGATIQAVYEERMQDAATAQGGTEPSGKAAFSALKALIQHEIPKGQKRDEVLKRIAVLDPEVATPESSSGAALDQGRVDKATYQKVMADGLVHLACSGGEFDRDILRGLSRSGRIVEAGPFAQGVVDSVLVPDCPVFATLDEADKEALGKAAKAEAPGVPELSSATDKP